MEQKINTNRIKVRGFSAELPGELDREKITYVTIEANIQDVGTPTNDDGTFDRVYVAKVSGQTIVKQEGKKDSYICKSKKTPSQILRQEFWKLNPDDDFYEVQMSKIIFNLPAVIDYLKNL